MRELAPAAALLLVGAALSACTYSGSTAHASTHPPSAAASSSGSVSSSASSSPSNSPPETTAPPRLQVLNCGGQRVTSSPTLLYLTCGDGTESVQGIRWTSFGGASAHGAGTLHQRSCTPNCASGKDSTTPAQVTLSGVTNHAGRRIYARLLVEAAGRQPMTLRLPG
ncbi:hypothetical protein [uncultured Jatrophihabitans sp.]|uniref:hypothetical protein n=1 Tax=uncultured Jatrophihabitans sp. TaxID=1610747 RepID=UPI0035C97BB3